MKQHRICLVSPGNVASNPRLVKEADALHAAGYQVRVVAGNYMAPARPLDRTILSTAPWAWEQVGLAGWTSRVDYGLRTLGQRGVRQLYRWFGGNLTLAAWAYHRLWDRFAAAAAKEPADLYIAHNLPALPAVAKAARQHQAKFGFDAEDFHTGELLPTPDNALEIALRDRLERTLLPHCAHLTAASPDIAQAYWQRYGVKPEPILNVFPLAQAPTAQPEPCNPFPSLYWFSQTIGPGRGLEAVITAMGRMKTPVVLSLRGRPASGYAEFLAAFARTHGVGERLRLLPSAPPEQMVALAAEHDLGLALELNEPHHRALCLTNKIFTYLLAGLPMLMSRTPAQESLATELGAAVRVVDLNEPEAIAERLDALLSNPTQLKIARTKAWQLGQERYNWDVEKTRFLQSVERALLDKLPPHI